MLACLAACKIKNMSAFWFRRIGRGLARTLAAVPAMATESIDSVRSLAVSFHDLLEDTISAHGFQFAEDCFYRRKAARIRAEMLDIIHSRRTRRLIKAVINMLVEDGLCAHKMRSLRHVSLQWSGRASYLRSRILWRMRSGFQKWTQDPGAARSVSVSQTHLTRQSF